MFYTWTTSFVRYCFIYLIAQSVPHWWSMFFTQQTSCLSHLLLIVHRYIYSRYSSVFSMLYQLYHSFPSSTLISSLSLYLKLQPELLLKVITLSWPEPKNVKDIRKFLGLANYYRRFIKNFAQVARPMNMLMRKDMK